MKKRVKITCVDDGRDVAHVTAILKNSDRYEIYWINARDKLGAESDVRIVVAKDRISARVKFATEIEKSSSSAIDYGTPDGNKSSTTTCGVVSDCLQQRVDHL